MFAEVVLSKANPRLDKIYHYAIPEDIKGKAIVGSQVQIPFGTGQRIGYIVGFVETSDVPGIKPITNLASEIPSFTENGLKLAHFISEYYFSFFNTSLRAILPPGTNKKSVKTRAKKPSLKKEKENFGQTPTNLPKLNNDQQNAVDKISESLAQQKGNVFLLYGPAGSGKTEVYLQAVEEALKNYQGAIVLTPEIGLTDSLVEKFKNRFGEKIAIIHSGLSDKERTEAWDETIKGNKQIVIGTRLAIFAPVKNLGLVILDEEYETTYKQEQNPRYHARTVAEYMTENMGVTTILGSSTPSIETYYYAQTGKYKLLRLNEKTGASISPTVEIIDMHDEPKRLLSSKLRNAIKGSLENNQKVILFLNRTGFFTYAYCRDCGKTITCPKCSISMSYHFKEHILRCSHCGHESKINIVCPNCQSSSIAFMGIGTQRIEEEVGEMFPKAKIIRIDRDSVTKKGSHKNLFAAFASGDANILIGTQMVTKGLDVADVTLVGIVSADPMLNIPDFRASERAFQQIAQVAGRSGRHKLPGKVIIQTQNPDHMAIKHAAKFDYDSFYNEEIKNREALLYPPFSKLINIIIHGKNEGLVRKVTNDLNNFLIRDHGSYRILGPVKATIEKLRGECRYQILLKGKEIIEMRKSLELVLSKLVVPFDVRIFVDIEPLNLL